MENQGIMKVYENTVEMIGPVPKQFECVYFVGMIAFVFIVVCMILSPIIILRGFKR